MCDPLAPSKDRLEGWTKSPPECGAASMGGFVEPKAGGGDVEIAVAAEWLPALRCSASSPTAAQPMRWASCVRDFSSSLSPLPIRAPFGGEACKRTDYPGRLSAARQSIFHSSRGIGTTSRFTTSEAYGSGDSGVPWCRCIESEQHRACRSSGAVRPGIAEPHCHPI